MTFESFEFKPIMFDSLGAKSSCCWIQTPDIKILLEPGIAALQPSFPASNAKKGRWAREGKKKIKRYAKKADLLTITHYHYDHYMPKDIPLYKNKTILAKNPNQWINDSQRSRAVEFYRRVCKKYLGKKLSSLLRPPGKQKYQDPYEKLEKAKNKDFGDYQARREELLGKWRKRFWGRVKKWKGYKRIPKLKNGVRVNWIDGRTFKFGHTKIRFSRPMFHGIEYSRVGWVCPIVIEYLRGGKKKLVYSSDLDGPTIEDYADWIIGEHPDILILDGPATYMFGYTINRINLNRAIDNAVRIIKNTNPELIIYDHHLARGEKFKQRTKKVWKAAKKEGKRVITAATYLDKKTKVLESNQ